MAKTVWQDTLEALRRDPSYSGMFHMMEKFGDDTAAEVSDKNDNVVRRTYREYIDMSLADCGVMEKKMPGDDGAVVGLIYDTCMDWPVLLWGILMSGKTPLLLNPASRPEQLCSIMAEARAKAYVAARPVDGCGLEFIDAADLLAGGEPGEEKWAEYIALCTSGTTGNSRIFLYNAQTIANHILSFDEAKQINPDMPFIEGKPCKLLAFLPFHHVFGFSVVYLLYACTGKVLVFCRDKAVQTILGTCSRHGVTHLYCVPIFFNALATGIRKKLDGKALSPIVKYVIKKKTLGTKIRSMITGGGHVPAETLEMLNDIGYPLCNGFGMTETGIIAVEKSLDPEQRKKGSIGEPFSLTEYRIGDGTTDEGELFIRGGALYSASMIDGEIVPRDESAWFATGDVVKRTPDGLFVCGRVKDVIINASGENIYPDEIEDLFAELPGVSKSCLLGVKNGAYEDVAIVSQRADGFDEKAYLDGIRKINDTLPMGERVTRAFLSSADLPISGSMKVMRQKLRDNLAELEELPLSGKLRKAEKMEESKAAAPAVPAQDAQEIEEIKKTVRHIVAEALNSTPEEEAAIADTDNFVTDLGMDSLDIFSCVAEIEEKYGIVILDTDANTLVNLNEASKYIYAKLHGLATAAAERSAPAEETTRITDFAESREYKEIKIRMAATFRDGFNPYFIPHDSVVRDTSVVNGRPVINLGSYNYLGMSGNPETEQAAIDAIRQYGTSASGARLLAGEKTLYQELEKEIAAWKHTEDAIVCTGGWATNVAFVSCFAREGDLIVYDALSHNSLTEGIRLSNADSKAFEHNDLAQLESILKKVEGRYNKVLIIVEGVYSMDGDIAPIPEFVKLKKQYKCFLMVDEAHSGGVIGEHAGGCDDYFGLAPDDIDIKYGTMSKALGTCGGYVAAKKEIIEYLKYTMNGFVFTAGIAPPLAAACKKAIEIIRRDNSAVTKLHENIAYFVKRAKECGMNTCLAGESAIVPIMIGSDADAAKLSAKLLEKGVFVPPAMYPAVPMGESRLRFTISSTHSIEQLETAVSELEKLMREEGLLK
ncbi:MAG: aminotransferase class I/II-fold pyridoxal phosphate-dependent enzyme [Oscillospiraceae bacterium]|nr:aminotransferase class I/II-fold pyridoxal phosphate-dependent enzyme [Oscillospiraceae bacterium]